MQFMSTFVRFSQWALEAVLIPPVLAVLVLTLLSLTLATMKQRPFKKELWKPRYWLVLAHFLFFPAVIAVGVIWANPVTNPLVPHHAVETGRRCLDLLWYASLASCAWWVWQMRGLRWFAASLVLLAEVLVFNALFISGMSVAGDWL
jgi:hypothetical protein